MGLGAGELIIAIVGEPVMFPLLFVFPLKAEYEKYNSTLEGAAHSQVRDKRDEEAWL